MYRNDSLFTQLIDFLPKVLPLINPAIKDSYFPTTLNEYPVLKYQSNGFPGISNYPSRVDISNLFRPSYGNTPPKVNLEASEGYLVMLEMLMAMPEIIAYYSTPNKKKDDDKWFAFACADIIENFVERYYYLHGDVFDLSKFVDIYIPFENYIYAENLGFDISVPILFVKFETDFYQLVPGIKIRRISDEVQRGRYKIKSYSPAILESVMMSATHELVLENYYYKKPLNYFQDPFGDAKIYPHMLIEQFFTTLKIATDITSGYAQILIHPINWVGNYVSDITSLLGTSVRNYPGFFDDYLWNKEEFQKVSDDQLEEVKSIFTGVYKSEKNQINFALKRFYKSTLRAEEEDIIVDLIIALEMLLSDSEKNEITHKLALRISTLLSKHLPEKYEPLAVFANVKKIYAYRSGIVHGNYKTKQIKEIKTADNTTVPIVNLANEYLREILSTVIHEPKYLEATVIDKLLLTGSL
ncbi:HEPN domain-containing protein [Pedobacter jejuensis]|uniref:Uncharacterized protein n=1 Tax=Pedobacter jejuensis TaxID=1268550 RepID=A0A3N0BVG7_9SPHI|nr:HEPN domain-containing protein [Pedobacter jejuensis]RNL52775.1 hypothetical protein D7004_10805 [Pedobacter jejuensis]